MMNKKPLGAVAVAAAAVLALSACARRKLRPERGQGRNQLLALGRQPAPRLPAVRRRLHQGQPGHHRQNHPSAAGTTTGPRSPTAWSPAPHLTSLRTTCPSTRSSLKTKQLLALDDGSRQIFPSTTKASQTSGLARTASATACPKTGTPWLCSTTRRWPPTPASPLNRWAP